MSKAWRVSRQEKKKYREAGMPDKDFKELVTQTGVKLE